MRSQRSSFVLVVVLACAVCGVVHASPAACPPGHWCGDQTRPGGAGSQETPLDAGQAGSGRVSLDTTPPGPPRQRRRHHALSLRVAQMSLSSDRSLPRDHLTSLGLSYRVRPFAWLGVEPGLDFHRGYDGFDAERGETSMSTDLLFYLNPQSAVQVLALGGATLSFARYSDRWAHSEATYLGVQAGMGLEFRVTHLLSFSANAVGISRKLAGASLRSREDSDTPLAPGSANGFAVRVGASIYFR